MEYSLQYPFPDPVALAAQAVQPSVHSLVFPLRCFLGWRKKPPSCPGGLVDIPYGIQRSLFGIRPITIVIDPVVAAVPVWRYFTQISKPPEAPVGDPAVTARPRPGAAVRF